MVKIKLAFRPEEQAEDAQEYTNEGVVTLNVQNFGDVSLMDQQLDLNASGPIGGLLVQPVPIHEDGDVFHLPFDLEGNGNHLNEDWIEAEDDDQFPSGGDGGGGGGYGNNANATSSAKARKAMMLRSQNTQDSSMADNSALAAVNMTLDSEMMHDATQLDEEEEQWHAFNPEEEEEDGERHVFDGDETGNFTKDSNVSSIELVRGDETDGQISMVSSSYFSGNNACMHTY